MSDFWDDDWDYQLKLWVGTKKSFSEFKDALERVVEVPVNDNQFLIGGIRCDVMELGALDNPPKFEGIPEEECLYLIKVPVTTELIWSAIDKPFVAGLFLSMKYSFKCNILLTADNDFFVAFSGTNYPFYINRRYRPWSEELSVFVEGEKVIELHM